MALNDEEVAKQIKQMVAFINQEASEKAKEIDVKAEEEFNIEKGRLVQQEKIKLAQLYERKEKQIEVKKKIAYSNELNQARLRILKSRDEHVQRILDEAQSNLTQISTGEKYKKLVQDLIAQALAQMLEDEVIIRCRQADVSIVQSVLGQATQTYTKLTNKQVRATIDNKSFLAKESSGGVEVESPDGKIKIVNTLENRLALVSKQMLPEIRTMLYGPSPTRVFFD